MPGETEPTPHRPEPTRRARPVSETAQQAYDRGVLDGQIMTRLDKHAQQIESLAEMIEQQILISQTLTATVQTLTEARVTDAATRVATAQAVKEARDAHEIQAQAGWSPVARVATVLGSLVGVLGILWAVLSSLPIPL